MTTAATRIESLDQFRGLTVFSMMFVNFVGSYPATPTTFRHHNLHCTYADVVMPMFLFAVGFAMRLTFPRRVEKLGRAAAYQSVVHRSIALVLLGCVIYHLTGEWKSWQDLQSQFGPSMILRSIKRDPFETLVHIGVASLWVLPVIESRPRVRIAFMCLSAALFLTAELNGYHQWNRTEPRGIEGGPLGFLSWTIPLLLGTLCCDGVRANASNARIAVAGLLVCALATAVMAVGNPTATWPFQPLDLATEATANPFSMRANNATVTLTAFGGGCSFIIYALCRWLTERGWTVSLFDLFGRNALGAYILHNMIAGAFKPFVPRDSPISYLLVVTTVYLFVNWLFVRYMDRSGIRIGL
jgi:predicted acyltransferase